MVNCWARTVVSFKWCDQAQVDKLDESVEWVWSIKTKTTGTWLSAIGWREDKLMGGGWGQPNDKWNKWLIPDFLGIWSKISNANLFVFLLNSVCWCKPSEESQRVLLEWGGSAREVKTGGKWDRRRRIRVLWAAWPGEDWTFGFSQSRVFISVGQTAYIFLGAYFYRRYVFIFSFFLLRNPSFGFHSCYL